jgi:hypothetical protein
MICFVSRLLDSTFHYSIPSQLVLGGEFSQLPVN